MPIAPSAPTLSWLDSVPEASSSSSKTKASGGLWQSLGVSASLARALSLRGFKSPTPIQRSTLPATLATPPRDVLGMARTGSGKTLAYIIPLVQRLISKTSPQNGPRALVLCPTRELAVQILKVGKDLSRGSVREGESRSLKWTLIMGGDALEAQFEALSNEPEIIVATPGRLLHLIVEMNLDLRSLEMVVYDEADRLFEMGFEVQLHEILHRLPTTRQNLLFSATLPTAVAEFTKAGLVNPLLLRLDAEQRVSEDLSLTFFDVKPTTKDAGLLAILESVLAISANVENGKSTAQAIIFVSTKHHVEYLTALLTAAGYRANHIYGSLDQVARQRQLAAFRAGDAELLVVTDVAARGLDIPVMDNVINYDFPSGVRNFVHRVGRTARAGRKGAAWSLVTRDDLPYLLDLQTFLEKPLTDKSHGCLYMIPQATIDLKVEHIHTLEETAAELSNLRLTMERGRSMFERSRTKASSSAHRAVKAERLQSGTQSASRIYPSFTPHYEGASERQAVLLASLQDYSPSETVWEMGNRGPKGSVDLMAARRRVMEHRSKSTSRTQETSSVIEITQDLEHSTSGHKSYRDQNYIDHTRKGAEGEKSYSIRDTNFSAQVRSATFDMTQDESAAPRAAKASQLKWDRKKKRFVSKNEIGADNKKMIRSESGALLPSSYKSGRYEAWRRTRRISQPSRDQAGSTRPKPKGDDSSQRSHASSSGSMNRTKNSELKSNSQILGARQLADKRKAKNNRVRRKR